MCNEFLSCLDLIKNDKTKKALANLTLLMPRICMLSVINAYSTSQSVQLCRAILCSNTATSLPSFSNSATSFSSYDMCSCFNLYFTILRHWLEWCFIFRITSCRSRVRKILIIKTKIKQKEPLFIPLIFIF
jgi:hypothetical protein